MFAATWPFADKVTKNPDKKNSEAKNVILLLFQVLSHVVPEKDFRPRGPL